MSPLEPEVLVFQTPPSLRLEPHIYDLFASVTGEWRPAWEPHGENYRDPGLIQKVAELGVVIAVDPLKRDPLPSTLKYFRLHGLGKGEVNYRYKYTDEDLRGLAHAVKNLKTDAVYIMFNNINMYQDALRFRQILHGEKV